MSKNEASKISIESSIGFIYWVNEHNDLRGLKNLSIDKYPAKLAELKLEFDKKYPRGLTGFSN